MYDDTCKCMWHCDNVGDDGRWSGQTRDSHLPVFPFQHL